MQASTSSRRQFLSGALALGTAVAAGSLMGGVPAAMAEEATWDMESEVVIVGFGGAGSAAAIEARKAGAEVLILEMGETGGGSTVLNGGFIYLGGTDLQAKLGIEDDVEEMYKYLSTAAGEYANKDAIKLLCDQSPDIYNWCLEVGITFPEVLDEGHVSHGRDGLGLTYTGNERARAFRDIAKPAPRGHVVGATGQGFFGPLSAAVEASGAQIVFNAEAKHLVVDESGRVVGVQAVVDGVDQFVRATKAVILAGGGFTNNAEMVFANFPYTCQPGNPVSNPNENGTCIKMGQEIGADLYGMSSTQFGNSIYSVGEEACKGILVSQNARRIIAEDEYGSFVGDKIMQNGPAAYLIIDSALKGVFDEAGSEPIAEGETVEDLAGAIGIDPVTLANTVESYNIAVANGEDGECGKDAQFLQAIEQAPFYAYDYSSENCYYMTQGGLKIDLDAHVINVFGEVIPGLYAAGRSSDITYGHYMGSGTSMLDCFVFGRIAGQNAAAE